MARLTLGLLLFVAGAATGALAVYGYLQRTAEPVIADPAPRVAIEPQTAARRGDGTVWVTLQNGLVSQRALGIVVREPAVVLLRFEDFIRAEEGWWRGADGRRRRLGPALAFDLDLGLLAFAAPDVAMDGLELSTEDGVLFLGRDVTLTSSVATTEAFVDSAAMEQGLNDYRYFLQAQESTDHFVAAVQLPQTGELVGVASRDPDGERWLAIDAGTLRSFLSRAMAEPVPSLARFSDVVFSQPQGLAVEFDQLIEGGRWRRALDTATALLDADPTRMGQPRRSQLYLSVAQLVRGLVAASRINEAFALASTSIERFGANEDLLRLASRVASRTHNSPRDAIDYLLGLHGLQSTYFRIDRAALMLVTRESVEAYVQGDAPQGESIRLLFDVIAKDNDHAPYHRQLGALLFESGRYTEAEFHLQRAVALDPRYAAEVARELSTSRQRRGVGETVIEAPLQTSGSGLYVDARLNGSQRTFRLLLDTGASYSAINTSTLLRLGLNDIFARGAPPVELETANGRIFAPSFNLGSIDVNGAVVQRVPVVVLEDMGPLDGLLGLSFLRHFDVQIDQRDNKLLLSPR